MWLEGSEPWNLCLRRNFNDLKTLEWASLLQLLFSVRFRLSPDSWTWAIGPSPLISLKSLMVDPLVKDLFSSIWMTYFPKKIKIFLWELNLDAVNTVDCLQHRMPYMSISPS